MAEDGMDTVYAVDEGNTQSTSGLTGFEISPQQRRIWMFHRFVSALHANTTLEIKGALDVDGLKRAVELVVAKHEILRTNFRRVPGTVVPVQVVNKSLPPEWHEIDLEELSSEARVAGVRDFLDASIGAPFSFENGSLFRVALLHLDADRCLLSLCLPSLCADAASLRIVVRELTGFYSDDDSADATGPLQYADLSDWQNQLIENETKGEAGHTFWKQQDFDVPDVRLPFEVNADEAEPFQLDSVSIPLDVGVVDRLRQVAASTEILPSAILAGCWQASLMRLGGASDILIFHVSEGRPDEDLQGAIGPLERWLPVRVAINSSAPTNRLWRRTNRAILDAVRWEHYWNWRGVGADRWSASDAFGFRYEESHGPLALGNLTVKICSRYSCIEPFKLQLSCMNSTDGLSLEFTYDTRRYREADIRRVADYYQVLLQNALQAPDAPISSLSMLPPLEREQILQEWNRTARAFPEVAAVHHLFEQHALAHPDSVALVFEDEQLTYSQLNARANRLAHLLQQRGVVPDRAVGLCLERGIDLIIGLLGILKAGGAYVPLDPTLPQERLCAMLQDSETTLWVSQASLASGLPGEGVLLDGDAALLDQYSADNPTSGVRSEHLVYVIYTSGSTGRPKGVGIEHRNLLNYVFGVGERLGLGVGASYATVSTLSADLGHTTLFSSLCLGGCLHLISSDRAMDPLRWREYFTRYEIDCLKIVGSHLSALLGSGPVSSEMLPRKVLVLGGEACRWELVSRIQSGAPGLRVLNHYGPTETTVGVLTYEVERGVDGSVVGSATVPLGRPLGNSRVYVLNSYQEPVPVGVVGELYIGGSGVGRGYVDREELTSERFLRDPFREDASSRMYRTGDQCRYLSDGNIEFLGRVDHQVKIRGYRIELGEIESVLLEHGSVREAVVLAREEASGEKRLVGYVVCHEGSVSGSELQEYLRLRLPEYMVPGWIVELPRLPLTSNGKVDRSSLPEPEETGSGVEVVAARTAVEEVLLGIWEELLRRDGLGVHQNFFELGGHSLLATQVISRIRETFEVDVPLRALFDAPTVASFGELMLVDTDARADIEKMAEMLVSLSGLSEEELEERLSNLQTDGAVA